MSINRIQRICDAGDHFYYPEIKKNVVGLLNNPNWILVGADQKTLYAKQLSLSALVQKIFHRIKLYFSHQYKTKFEKSVKALQHSIRTEAVCTILRDWKAYRLRKEMGRRVTERKIHETEKYKTAILSLKKFREKDRLIKRLKALWGTIAEQKKIKDEASSISLKLKRKKECHENIKELDEKKKSSFFGESKENQEQRKTKSTRINRLNNSLLGSEASDSVKECIKSGKIDAQYHSIIDKEIKFQDQRMLESDRSLEEAKTQLKEIKQSLNPELLFHYYKVVFL